MSDDEWWRSSGPPIPVADGLRITGDRKNIGRTWWSRRFVESLEALGLGGRFERGRRYARAGQVLSMSLSTSIVVAQVQGSRPEPYRVRIGIKAFTDAEWADVEKALAGQALFLAKLLAGELPHEIEAVFETVGLQLFPVSARELSMDCSCPDWEVPCKHLAAISYLLAESFDSDPFEYLAWRGRSRQQLLDGLRGPREQPAEAGDEALVDVLDNFWGAPVTVPAVAAVRAAPDAVLDQVGPLPLTVGGRPLVEWLRPAYRALAEADDQ
ncbi:putative Zn finger protein [Actinokineospora baliensis]|uniref:SWIM zinc finger family protein n=1 Tax=Actinokineospora baliensis TaxID=547056 RepID=UPI00195ECF29|nr:SWIM zinc finger family protein [Actinokineospora baliensis]MBM7776350.1 putative Zn finger protein [Actinokineospora baliensis]